MWTISSASDTSGAAGARGHRLSLTALDVTMLRDRHPWVLFAVGAFVLVLLLDLGGHTGIGLASYGVVIPGWGFAVLWLSIWVDGQGWWRSRHARFTMAAIAVATCAVSLSEGVHPVVALLRGPGVLAQAVLTCLLWWRFRPAGRSVGSVAGIWRLLLASLIGALPDLMFSPYGLVSLLPVNADRVFPGLAGAALWVLRGSASAFCLTILGHAILERPAEAVPWPSPRVLLGLATATAGAYGLGVMFNQRLYLLIPVIMWAASVLSVRGAALYSGVILIAAQGMSPLAVTAAGNALDGAFAAETFTLLVVVVTMALARDRQDRERLLGLATARSREAAEQADLMTTIVEAGADAVLTVASDGRVLLANGPAQRLADRLGISMLGLLALAPAGRSSGAGQVVGGQAVGAGQAVSAGQAPVAVVLAGGPATTADVVVRREDAPATIVAIRAFPMTHRGVTGAVVFLADVTEERARTEGLRHFARTVAHDLRNPLTGIALSAELAASALDEGDAAEAAAMMEAVRRSGDRATTLIRDIADYTLADGDVKLAPVCVGELVAGLAAARLGEAGSVPLDLRIDADVNVRADARLLARLFDNLLATRRSTANPGVCRRSTWWPTTAATTWPRSSSWTVAWVFPQVRKRRSSRPSIGCRNTRHGSPARGWGWRSAARSSGAMAARFGPSGGSAAGRPSGSRCRWRPSRARRRPRGPEQPRRPRPRSGRCSRCTQSRPPPLPSPRVPIRPRDRTTPGSGSTPQPVPEGWLSPRSRPVADQPNIK